MGGQASERTSPGRSLDTLSIFGVIVTGWRLYWAHFSQYVAIALRGMLWVLLPTALLLAVLLWILKQGAELRDFSGLSALFVPAWLVLLLWCKAQSLGCLAGISRLVYQSLAVISLGEAGEAPERSLKFTRSRRFSLLGSVLVKGLILGIAVVAFGGALLLSAGMIFAGMGMVPGAEPSLSLFFLGGGSALISVAVFAGLYGWLVVRLLIVEQSLAIEQNSGVFASIGRSWQLTSRNVLRTACVAALTFLVSLPVLILVWLAAQSVSFMVLESVGIRLSRTELSSVDFLPLTISYLIMTVVGMIGDIITQPFFRAVFTTLYLDVRNRKENTAAM